MQLLRQLYASDARYLWGKLMRMPAFEESEFVTCVDCDDYDLCIPCHVNLKHGHNPSHTFSPLSELYAEDFEVKTLCAPGRNMRHFASCDGCDKVCTSSIVMEWIKLTRYRPFMVCATSA